MARPHAPQSDGPAAQTTAPDDLTIRSLQSANDYRRCVEAQRRVWGEEFGEVVPASILQISQKVGGVAAGAFSGEGALVGFVYGLTGIRRGRRLHWSHMLGVLPGHRSRGIGRALKEFQRARVREVGVSEILWTFDPLIAGNAHLNLNHLGVEIDAYEPEMYGDTGSDLHSFGTDRVIARWDLAREEPEGGGERPRASAGAAGEDAEPASALPRGNDVPGREDQAPCDPGDLALRRLVIEIPENILEIHRTDPTLAWAWRESTRAGFLRALGAGFRVVGFVRPSGPTGGLYLLERGDG